MITTGTTRNLMSLVEQTPGLTITSAEQYTEGDFGCITLTLTADRYAWPIVVTRFIGKASARYSVGVKNSSAMAYSRGLRSKWYDTLEEALNAYRSRHVRNAIHHADNVIESILIR